MLGDILVILLLSIILGEDILCLLFSFPVQDREVLMVGSVAECNSYREHSRPLLLVP